MSALGAMRLLSAVTAIAAGAGMFFAPFAAIAQATPERGALVSVSVAPETVTVGQPFTVRIRVRAPKFATIHFPAVPDTADAIEAVDPRATEDAGDAELIDRTAIYRLVAWDVGTHTPHFASVTVGSGGAEQQYAVTIPALTVRSLLPADSADRVPKDARDPLAPPGILWKVLLIGALLLGALAWYFWRRRVRRALTPPKAMEPFAAATESFEALDELKLPEAGEAGRHVIASVDVLRSYLARRFPDMRDSLTAQEIERAIAGSDVPVLPQRIVELLRRESSVRFARAPVTSADAIALGKQSEAIVRDIQAAYEARVRQLERSPKGGRRR